jgi:hypothetical protein
VTRSGLSLVEVLVAALVLAVVAIPLLDLFRSGIHETRAGLDEVLAANLAAELGEQLETLPFASLAQATGPLRRRYSSADASLVPSGPIAGASGDVFRCSPLPHGFSRSVSLQRLAADVLLAEVLVEWSPGGVRPRRMLVRRCLTRDSLLPE